MHNHSHPGHRRHPWGRSASRCALVLTVLAAMATGCGDPCRDLSDTICNCLPSRLEQQACRKRVHNLAAQAPKLSDDARQVCHNLLQACSCEALAAGDYASCGLAHD